MSIQQPVVTDHSDQPVIMLPTLTVRGYSGWLCHLCLRALCPNRQPWSWFACENCRAVDARVAGVFGARRFLPLGQHSMMNGLGLKLTDASDATMTAFHERLTGLVRGWHDLSDWRDEQVMDRVAIVRHTLGDDVTDVPLSDWTTLMAPGAAASARDYHRLLRCQHDWLLAMDPRFADVRWLAGDYDLSDADGGLPRGD